MNSKMTMTTDSGVGVCSIFCRQDPTDPSPTTVVVKSTHSGTRLLGFRPQLCPLLTVTQGSAFTQGLGFPTCNGG